MNPDNPPPHRELGSVAQIHKPLSRLQIPGVWRIPTSPSPSGREFPKSEASRVEPLNRRKTSNIQHPTSNTQRLPFGQRLDVGRWMLDVGCSLGSWGGRIASRLATSPCAAKSQSRGRWCSLSLTRIFHTSHDSPTDCSRRRQSAHSCRTENGADCRRRLLGYEMFGLTLRNRKVRWGGNLGQSS